MNNAWNKGQKKRRGWWWKIPLGLLLLLFIGLVAAILNINSIAHYHINHALERFFSEGGTLDAIDIQLKEGRIELVGLTINPPQGYGTEPLLSLNTLELDVDLTSLFGDKIVVEQLAIEGLSLILLRDKQGRLLNVWVPAVSDAEQLEKTAVVKSSAGDRPAAASGVPTLVFEDIQLRSIAFQFLDSVNGKPWRVGFDRLDINVTGLEVGDFAQQAISLDSFTLDLRGTTVDQPPGFDTGKLASLEHFEVTTAGLDLASPELIIKQVLVQGLSSSVIMHPDGLSNLQQLNEALLGMAEETSESKAQPEVETDVSTPENVLPVVRFEQIRMEGGSFNYRDEALTEEALDFPLADIRLAVTQLRLFDNNAEADPASASVSFELGQPGDLPTACFGGVAAIGPVNSGVPPVNFQFRLTGFKLDTLGSLVSPATRKAMGATGFDAGLALALDADTIKLQASMLSDRNIHYDAIKVQGPLDDPDVDMGPVLARVYSRVSDSLRNLGKSGLRAGVDIAEGGVNVTKEVGSGVLKVSKNIGNGLFKAGAGMVTLDKQQLREGVAGSTRGTTGLTVDSVKGAGGTAGGGLKSSVSNLKGDAALQAWDRGIQARFQAAMQQAKEALVEMPYPPVTD